MLSTVEIKSKYGEPNEQGSYLTIITLPYPMRLAWDKTKNVNSMRCHIMAAESFKNVFVDLLAHYGYEKLYDLGIDLFGGCFSFRSMRGGNDYSRHSWGIAIDLDPERNMLTTKWSMCQFSKVEYKPMIEIFYKHGFVSLGLEKGYDGMHFELKS